MVTHCFIIKNTLPEVCRELRRSTSSVRSNTDYIMVYLLNKDRVLVWLMHFVKCVWEIHDKDIYLLTRCQIVVFIFNKLGLGLS